jgi:hypothetical protein
MDQAPNDTLPLVKDVAVLNSNHHNVAIVKFDLIRLEKQFELFLEVGQKAAF